MKVIDTSKLSDTELNRAMIWLYPREDFLWEDSIGTVLIDYMSTVLVLDYLGDWSLLMPLAVEHNLSIDFFCGDTYAHQSGFGIHLLDRENPLRAICCALVQIAMEKNNER